MFLKIVGLLFIFINTAFAANFTVIDGLKRYQLDYDGQLIKFEASMMKLNLRKKDCNSDLIKKFAAQTDGILLRATKHIDGNKGFLEVTRGKETFFIAPQSQTGKYLRLIPEEIKRLKVEESLRCKK